MDRQTDERVIAAFLAGRVDGLAKGSVEQPQHIQTFLSHLFFFENRVYKLYRRDNEECNRDFVDLATPHLRWHFIRRDFEYNHFMASHVYLRILGIRVGDAVSVSDVTEGAYDLLIEMDKIDERHCLTTLLQNPRSLTQGDLFSIGKQFSQKVLDFPKELYERKDMGDYISWWLGRMDDVQHWTEAHKGYQDPSQTKGILDVMRAYIHKHSAELRAEIDSEFSALFDCHTDNLFYYDGTVSFLDMYLIKPEWRNGPYRIALYRIAADIWAICGEQACREFLAGCKAARPHFDGRHERFLLLYAALIRAPYVWGLAQTNPKQTPLVKLYDTFVAQSAEELKKVL